MAEEPKSWVVAIVRKVGRPNCPPRSRCPLFMSPLSAYRDEHAGLSPIVGSWRWAEVVWKLG